MEISIMPEAGSPPGIRIQVPARPGVDREYFIQSCAVGSSQKHFKMISLFSMSGPIVASCVPFNHPLE